MIGIQVGGGRVLNLEVPRAKVEYTDLFRRQIRKISSPGCPKCKGEGIVKFGRPDMTLCRCVRI